jgi:ABC-type transport system involved in cytochrome bd biosynthesis fused ATPase/permease subunit
VAHPLLAIEFAAAARRLKVVGEGRGSAAWAVRAQKQIVAAHATRRRLRRRLRAARLMYRLNLPLTEQTSTNFAVTTAADRIDRLAEAFASYLATAEPSSTGGSDV